MAELVTYINGIKPDNPSDLGPQGCNVYALLLINASPGFGPPNATKNDRMVVSVNDVPLVTWQQTSDVGNGWCPSMPATITNPFPPPPTIPNPNCSTYLGTELESARLIFLNQRTPLTFGSDTWPNTTRIMPNGADSYPGETSSFPSIRGFKNRMVTTWHNIAIDDYVITPNSYMDFAYAGIITLDFVAQCYDTCAGPRFLRDKSGGWIGIVRYKKYNNQLYCDKYLPVYDNNFFYTLINTFPGIDNAPFISQWFFYWWTEPFLRSAYDRLPSWVPIQDQVYDWPTF